jgi:hypothetical protein
LTVRPDSEYFVECIGWELYFMGVLIAHESKVFRNITLLSTETEYYALSEVTKNIIYAK